MEIKLARRRTNSGLKLTPDQIHECIKLYTEGASTIQIARQFGVKSCVVVSALKRNNIKVYARNTRYTEEFSNKDLLIEGYNQGKSVQELSRMFNLGPSTIKLILVKEGIFKAPSNQKVTMSQDHLNEAIQLAKQGLAYKEIGMKLGYSVWTINKSLYEAGIQRKKGEPNLSNYQAKVRRLTEHNYKKHKDLINPTNLPRGKKLYHIDHIYSVYNGFMNKIPAEVISHPINLQLLPYVTNIAKRTNSHHTLEEMLDKIRKFQE